MRGEGTATFVQARADWLDLVDYADVVFWVEVRSVSNPGAGNIVLTYETAPAMEESLFQPLGTVTLAVASTPVITKVELGSNPSTPLARYVRWKLAGTAAGSWSVSLRIFAMANKGSGGAFNVASLALTGWWRASYAGSPWVGTASNGTSGSHDLTEATNPPAVGTAVNGLAPADFDGTNDQLSNASPITDFVSASAGSIACLFYADAAFADGGSTAYYNMPGLFMNSVNGYLALTFSTSGVRLGSYDTVSALFDSVAAACGTGAWHLGQGRWDSTTLEVRVDGGAWQTMAKGVTLNTDGISVGTSFSAANFFDGKILELMSAQSRWSDSDFDNIKSYVNARYALSL